MLTIRSFLPLLIFCAICHQVSGEDQLISVSIPDSHIRPGHLLPIVIEADAKMRSAHYPLEITYGFSDDPRAQKTSVSRWEDLNQGILLHLRTPQSIQQPTVLIELNISNATQQTVKQIQIKKPSIVHFYKSFNQLLKQFPREQQSDFQKLCFEQLALTLKRTLRSADFPVIQNYIQLIKEQHSFHQVDNCISGVFRSTCDNSVHPLRLYQTKSDQHNKPASGLVVLCRHYRTAPNKADWETCDERIIKQALAHNFACVDMYPAGDSQGNGISGLRIADCLRAVEQLAPALRTKPIHFIGIGHGCRSIWRAQLSHGMASSLIFDQTDLNLGPLLLSDQLSDKLDALSICNTGFAQNIPAVLSALNKSRSIEEQDRLNGLDLGPATERRLWQWLQARNQNSQWPTVTKAAPLTAIGSRPLICIVGKGEHLTAKQEIADILRSLQGAWAVHAQAQLPIIAATDCDLADYISHDILFIGTPLDNQALHSYFTAQPQLQTLHWDHRFITGPSSQHLKSQILSLTWRLNDKKRTVWVLSGPGLRFPIGPLPLQNTASRLVLEGGQTVWSAE